MVFQSYALWPHMSVAENVGFGLDIRGVSGDERRRRIMEALDAVQMGTYAERKPNQLSGGQQQRVALARALVIRPDVLLLDEPLSNLDAKLRNELRSEIRRICKAAGITGVYVTHDQKEALSMADRVAVINQGKVVQVAPPARLYRSPRNRFVAEFLGETNLMPGRIVEKQSGGETGSSAVGGAGDSIRVIVETPVGRLVSASVSRDVDIEKALDARNADDPAGHVLVSIRPEAVRVDEGNGVNNVFARLRESTYLGETAQWIVEVGSALGSSSTPAAGAEWKVAVLNPLAAGVGGPDAANGGAMRLSVRPEDVVLLPPPAGGVGSPGSGSFAAGGGLRQTVTA
jgi:iron(III) transport system ATP-binding protein